MANFKNKTKKGELIVNCNCGTDILEISEIHQNDGCERQVVFQCSICKNIGMGYKSEIEN